MVFGFVGHVYNGRFDPAGVGGCGRCGKAQAAQAASLNKRRGRFYAVWHIARRSFDDVGLHGIVTYFF